MFDICGIGVIVMIETEEIDGFGFVALFVDGVGPIKKWLAWEFDIGDIIGVVVAIGVGGLTSRAVVFGWGLFTDDGASFVSESFF